MSLLLLALPVASSLLIDDWSDTPPSGGSHTVAPPYTTPPALRPHGRPRGSTFQFELATAESRYFNGSGMGPVAAGCDPAKPAAKQGECCIKEDACKVRARRNVWVYVPASLEAAQQHRAAPIMVMQDGPSLFEQVSLMLDNLPQAVLPAFVAISIQNGGSDAIKSERGLEYDTLSPRYADFVEHEVLPAVLRAVRASLPAFGISAHSAQRATLGCSSGGAAALTMGWFRPERWGRIAAYSATLVDQQDHSSPSAAAFPLGAWEYHSGGAQLIKSTPVKPLRIFTHCAEFDLGYQTNASAVENRSVSDNTDGNCAPDWGRWPPVAPTCNWTDGHHNWRVAGNRTAAALKARGYAFRHVFAQESIHCDSRVLEATLVTTLIWLWRSGQEGERS